MRAKIIWSLIIVLIYLLSLTTSEAKISEKCDVCHTIHNSQDGLKMAYNTGPNPSLLRNDCIGCHTGTNITDSFPFVLDTLEPDYIPTGTEGTTNTLAGGNFYWGVSNDSMGHNVVGITTNEDQTLHLTPPGGTALGARLACAGQYGCHGDRSKSGQFEAMKNSHHYTKPLLWQDGSTIAKSYRFLDGIQGFGHTTYEYRPSQTSHNKYYGKDRSLETDNAAGTISSLCSQCHGDFHNGSGNVASGGFGGGVWLRHPTDFDMGRASISSEFDSYNGGSGTNNPYSVISPVATANTGASVNQTVYTSSDDAIVMCLSCHRPHGTPYSSLLRWNYKGWPGLGGYNGCAKCHTEKN
ncbi:MAG: cytochrome c3 family protein [Thermodesulfobacteriota bacterium]|nr:cytochrome c3 family protein [Thermodesulfobacteriota bacterium]